jgi:hypothetical protein
MAGKTQSQKKKALDMRSKMYLVLALCSVMLLVSVGISLVLIGGIGLGGADAQSVSTVDSASMVVESGYNKEENTIDTQAYTSTILEQSADAGDSYVDETLFLLKDRGSVGLGNDGVFLFIIAALDDHGRAVHGGHALGVRAAEADAADEHQRDADADQQHDAAQSQHQIHLAAHIQRFFLL